LVPAARPRALPRRPRSADHRRLRRLERHRTRLWKVELQKLADQIGLPISVCHFPPGTSKWNRIEHRLFSHTSMNWRGKPLISHQVIISLIAATTTRSGLKVHARLDQTDYPKGIKVRDRELAAVQLTGHAFHPEWNYTIRPRPQPPALETRDHAAALPSAR
jgi:hypothetical protein